MPRICEFYGIRITLNFNDHPPPHFHAQYAEHEALVTINPPAIYQGHLPARAMRLVMEWAILHQEELMENWLLAQSGCATFAIEPIE